ncbi:MAG: germination lipoprotein GerS-related protein [Inconstantimicrobium porci]|uniref:germination lipoprotein GerS-related protein n=1 Tax=Inconstantimicrobium porci TaxID=2652291 RepID=UPI00240A61BE|nr:germination lipoprotein GerS-related protein [Inconstantimicrobium porci]MDD6771739.1 germination lipoprotein GerS-related protein [Inconstantimicrobium porci]MDY5911553.1 germination lipoprotein GerS-related protein [Inconstantimicrobium porci]
MKKIKIPLIIILVIVGIISCLAFYQKLFKETPENIMTRFKKMKSYSCNVEYTIKNPRCTTVQKATLKSEGQGNIELKFDDGRIFKYSNKDIVLSNENTKEKFTLSKEFDKFYKLSFMENIRELLLLNGENLKVIYNKEKSLGYLEIEYQLYDNNKELNKCKLFINTENSIPVEMIIFDDTGEERIKVDYSNFVVSKLVR